MKPLYIKWVNTGVANRFDEGDFEVIEMNWRLKMYPDLFNEVLMHEVNHQEDEFSKKDLIHDMTSKTKGLFGFMKKHISSWTQLFPIYWHFKRKTIVYDWSAITTCFILLGCAYATFWFLDWGMYLLGRLSW